MITHKDPMTLQYVNAGGTLSTVGMNDWSLYSQIDNNLQAQKTADSDNAHALDMYMQDLKKFNDTIASGRIPEKAAPTKPKATFVSDMGVVSIVDFNPPLPDPEHLTVLPNQTATSMKQENAPFIPDPIQQAMFNALMGITQALNSLTTALKSKGVI